MTLKKDAAAIDRNYYLGKIEQFYDKYPEGPEKVVSELSKLYTEYFFKEASLKKMFDEYQSEVRDICISELGCFFHSNNL